jgi:hypothetical protein
MAGIRAEAASKPMLVSTCTSQPTSASWSNMVKRFFAEITRNRIRRRTFKSVAELKSAIMQYLSFFSSGKISVVATRECLHSSLENRNADLKPFIWTKSAGEILEKVARAKQSLESQH